MPKLKKITPPPTWGNISLTTVCYLPYMSGPTHLLGTLDQLVDLSFNERKVQTVSLVSVVHCWINYICQRGFMIQIS